MVRVVQVENEPTNGSAAAATISGSSTGQTSVFSRGSAAPPATTYDRNASIIRPGFPMADPQPNSNGAAAERRYSRDEFTRWLKSSPKKIVETLKSEFCARMFFSDAMDAAEVIREVERFLAEQQKLYATFQHIEAILRDRMAQGLPMALARTRILRMGMGRAKSDIAWAEQTLAELKEQGEKREGDENGNQSFIGR